jgi:hypothetical protein
MGTTRGNSLCSYLYLKLAKHHFSFYLLRFFFCKMGEQEGKIGFAAWMGAEMATGTGGRGQVAGKGVGG